ncbi:MAG TPA: class 1 fructose-bisphosphatase [Bacteroidetes bacterium]|nr:class 1 fructose-bisphosphatase [Bacteroidota bacterium]
MVSNAYSRLITLEEFIIQGQNRFRGATGELSQLLRDIVLAAKIVSYEINKAGITNILGRDGNMNVHGEFVKKLDVFANDQMIHALSRSNNVCMIVSEENEHPIKTSASSGKYVVATDPLDGSSNIDVNVSIGTIFSIYMRKSHIADMPDLNDALQNGVDQVAAGYILYGSSTTLVYTTGLGVTTFTLDPGLGEFFLSEVQVRIPESGNIYSMNEGNISKCSQGLRDYIKSCKVLDEDNGKPYTARYIGSMVSDVHRTLQIGGVFMYPESSKMPYGKLRLMYECNPLSFLIEQAGGIAINHEGKRIMEVEVTDIHQRSPIYMGSPINMKELMGFMLK